ncbi:hypothetical protein EAX61_13425 [Dokdonia sinensis]|uniref:Phosphatase PAP2 family protein n=1 Tax=Dokdonia sinensis TaxID=2479847 RepID=A0A3M0FVT2_9FLAO|nr:hypothetical protein [Dokdonia sinensis]RMB56791.1 hypothetical protein EAX61_13425 [Dokdonia sinensis]
MRWLIKSFSYIFHPLWMPLIAVIIYYVTTPRFMNPEFWYAKFFATTIMTVIIPILSFYMFKNLNLVTEIHLKDVKERKFPLLFQGLFTLLIIYIVFKGYELPELHFFFVGVLGSTLAALVLVLFQFKASLHMIGICGVLFFVLGLSIHFNSNMLWLISLLVLACGATATSRLEAKAHTPVELVVGTIVGAVPQFLAFPYWL